MLLLSSGICLSADRYPSIKTAKFGNCYDDWTDMMAAVKFWATSIDAIVNGGNLTHASGTYWFDSLKILACSASTSIETYYYVNTHYEQVCGDTTDGVGAGGINALWARTMAECDNESGVRESCFVHVGDDSLAQGLNASGVSCAGYAGGQRFIEGGSPSPQNRFSHDSWWDDATMPYYPAGQMWIYNYWYSKIKTIRPKGMLEYLQSYLALDSAVNGVYADNCCGYGAACASSYLHVDSSLGGTTGGGSWITGIGNLDWYELPGFYSTNLAALWSGFASFHTAVCDTLWTEGYRPISNFCNTSSTMLEDILLNGVSVVSDVFFETRLANVCIETWSGIQGDLNRMTVCRNHPEVRNYWEYRVGGGEANDTGNSWSAHTSFGAFLVIQDTNSFYTYQGRFNNGGNDGDTLYWTNFDLMTVDLGSPTASVYTTTDTGMTNGGYGVHLMSRQYDNGWALYLPKEASGSDTTDYYTYDLGMPVYVLGESNPGHMDSTYKADGVITIKYQHAVIALVDTEAPAKGPEHLKGNIYKGGIHK